MTTGQRGRRRAPRVVVVGGGAAGTLVATHLVRSATLRGTRAGGRRPRAGRPTGSRNGVRHHRRRAPAQRAGVRDERAAGEPRPLRGLAPPPAPHAAGGSDGVRSSAGARALPRGHPRGLLRSGPGRRRRPAGACPRPGDPSYGGGAGAHHERREPPGRRGRSWSRPASPPRVTTGPRGRCWTRPSSCPTLGARRARTRPARPVGHPDVVLVGTGLTMVDVALSLSGEGSRPDRCLNGLSRNGRLPRRHADEVRLAAIPDVSEWGATLEELRVRVGEHVDRVRRDLGRLAARRGRAPLPGRRACGDGSPRRTAWRSSPRRRARGTCCVTGCRRAAPAGSTSCARPGGWRSRPARSLGGRAAGSRWLSRHAGATAAHRRRLGGELHRPAADVRTLGDPLLDDLLRDRPGGALATVATAGMGFRTVDGRVVDASGSTDAPVWTLGALRRGELWESTAVPEIRSQAWLWPTPSSTRSRRCPAGSRTAASSAGTTRSPGPRPAGPAALDDHRGGAPPTTPGWSASCGCSPAASELFERGRRARPGLRPRARRARHARSRGRRRRRRTPRRSRRARRGRDHGRRPRAQPRRRRRRAGPGLPRRRRPALCATSRTSPARRARGVAPRCRRSRSPASPTCSRRPGTWSRAWPRRTATTGGTARCSPSSARTRRATTRRRCSPRARCPSSRRRATPCMR